MINMEGVETLVSKATEAREFLASEEGSKTSLVLPMLSVLGYDVFDPKHIMAELVADVGVKRGEKVDYAIMSSGKPKLIIECKKLGDSLGLQGMSQLFRYFTASRVKFGVLTDGIVYRFFSDLEAPNRMDSTPFFEFSLLAHTHADLEFLFKFRKGCLMGQMKGLLKECKRRRLISIIRSSVQYTLQPTAEFVDDIKETLLNTGLVNVSKKELTLVASSVVLEEAIKVVERSLEFSTVLPEVRSIISDVVGSDIEELINYRTATNSIYLYSMSGSTLARIYKEGLMLKVSLNGQQDPKSLRVVGDLRKYNDIIRDIFTLPMVRS